MYSSPSSMMLKSGAMVSDIFKLQVCGRYGRSRTMGDRPQTPLRTLIFRACGRCGRSFPFLFSKNERKWESADDHETHAFFAPLSRSDPHPIVRIVRTLHFTHKSPMMSLIYADDHPSRPHRPHPRSSTEAARPKASGFYE